MKEGFPLRQKSLNLYLSHLAAIWGPILLLLLIVVTYSNSFHGAFVFDDRTEVLEAGPVRSIEGVVRWPLAHPTRTVGDLTFLLNRRWGGDSPVGYHVVNLALHCAVALLLLGILRRILGRIPPLELSKETAEMLALAITVIWALHPIQTQAVTYLSLIHI